MEYYGVITTLMDKTVEKLDGEYDFKPSLETVGFSSCHWFKDQEKQKAFIDYMIKEGFTLEDN